MYHHFESLICVVNQQCFDDWYSWERAVKQTEDDLHRKQNNGAALWNGPGLLHKQTHESCLNNLVYINKLAVNYPTGSSLSIIIKPLCGSRAMFAKYKDKSCLHRYRLERIHTYGVHVVVPQSFRTFTRKQPLEGNKLRIHWSGCCGRLRWSLWTQSLSQLLSVVRPKERPWQFL